LKSGRQFPRGRSGRALSAWLARDGEGTGDQDAVSPSSWRRIPVSRGVELNVEASHPLARLGADERGVADLVRAALAKLLPQWPA
jgi:hypothetical protein